MNIESKYLCFIGDIHGEFRAIVNKFTSPSYELEDTTFIVLGDFGVGFEKPGYYDLIYEKIKDKLEKSNCYLYGIRGNHDDPVYYKKDGICLNYERFKTLPDYEVITWNDKRILPIGGAVSIDFQERLIENAKLAGNGSSHRVWWPEENLKEISFENLPRDIDIIISHEAPESCGPVAIRGGIDLHKFQEILKGREYLRKVLLELHPKQWYFGHYHKSFSGSYLETKYHGLDIDEIMEVNF